jgi:hypothetical protein
VEALPGTFANKIAFYNFLGVLPHFHTPQHPFRERMQAKKNRYGVVGNRNMSLNKSK